MSKRRKIRYDRVVAILIVGMFLVSLLGLFFNFAKYPEQYLNTWKYQLENEVKNGDIRAIEYYTTNYLDNDKKLFEDEILKDLGTFEMTAYCSCEKCCGKTDGITASGVRAQEGVTVAADTNILPIGTKIYVDGNEYIVQDVGGAVKGNKLDIYCETHEKAVAFGVQYKNVYIKG